MAAYTTLQAAFGRLPDDVDDDRFVEAWVNLVADAILRMAHELPSAEADASAQ
jgi:hypothetical protein